MALAVALVVALALSKSLPLLSRKRDPLVVVTRSAITMMVAEATDFMSVLCVALFALFNYAGIKKIKT